MKIKPDDFVAAIRAATCRRALGALMFNKPQFDASSNARIKNEYAARYAQLRS